LAVSSGTAAIKIALKALGVKPGDEVITQAFNFIATVEAILDVGAIPVITNVDDSLNMDPFDCEALLSPKTRIILPVHMLGIPVNMSAIQQIAEKHNLKILEDACESVGAKYDGAYIGTIGDAGAFSFDYGKVITTGEGGMILCNDADTDKYAREYHDHGHENNPKFPRGKDTKTIYGFNYRMTELQGAIGKVQLKKLNHIISENQVRYRCLEKELSPYYRVRKIHEKSEPIFDAFIFHIENEKIKNACVNILTKHGLGTKNLPDAIEWHCAGFWDHALEKSQIAHCKPTREILEKSVAIPIWLQVDLEVYGMVAKRIAALVS
jgi:8-amino-3,8-dideoxy-alpha-D-manno-octulosonate transaminase